MSLQKCEMGEGTRPQTHQTNHPVACAQGRIHTFPSLFTSRVSVPVCEYVSVECIEPVRHLLPPLMRVNEGVRRQDWVRAAAPNLSMLGVRAYPHGLTPDMQERV